MLVGLFPVFCMSWGHFSTTTLAGTVVLSPANTPWCNTSSNKVPRGLPSANSHYLSSNHGRFNNFCLQLTHLWIPIHLLSQCHITILIPIQSSTSTMNACPITPLSSVNFPCHNASQNKVPQGLSWWQSLLGQQLWSIIFHFCPSQLYFPIYLLSQCCTTMLIPIWFLFPTLHLDMRCHEEYLPLRALFLAMIVCPTTLPVFVHFIPTHLSSFAFLLCVHVLQCHNLLPLSTCQPCHILPPCLILLLCLDPMYLFSSLDSVTLWLRTQALQPMILALQLWLESEQWIAREWSVPAVLWSLLQILWFSMLCFQLELRMEIGFHS